MDLDPEPAPGGEVVETVKDEKIEKEEKPKKRVVIDENKQIRQIENTKIDRHDKPKSRIRQNIETTTWPWRISCLSFILGFIFHVISYGTPHWIIIELPQDDEMRAGFWGACVEGSGCSFRNTTTGCINTVRGFGGVAVLCGIVELFLLYFHSQRINNRRNLGLTAAGFCFGSALCIQIAAGVFGHSGGCGADESGTATGTFWGWSLALAFVSVVMIVVSGLILLILELRVMSRDTGGKRAWNGRGVIIT